MLFISVFFLSFTPVRAQQPDPVQEEEVILPEGDPLKTDRFNVEFLIAEGMHFIAIDNNAKALESFIKANQIMPDNAAVNYKIAELYHEAGQLDEASLYANKALMADKSQYIYAKLLAEIQTDQGNLAGSIATYEEMYRQSDDVPDDYLIELAAIYLYNEQPDKALKTYDRIERRLGILEEISTQKQKILLKQNKLKEAIDEGKKLVEAYPRRGEYAVSVAQILVSNGKNEEAIDYLNTYLSENKNQAVAQLELAQLYMQTNTPEKAKPYFAKAFQSEEISLKNKLNNFVPMIRRLPDESMTPFLKELSGYLLNIHPNESNALAASADMYFALNDKDSALLLYKKAIKNAGNNFQLWQNVLSLQMEMKDYEGVAKHANEAMEYFPNQPVIYLFSGSAYFSLKQYSRAIMMWEQGKAIVYGNNKLKSTFAAQLADAYHANKDFEKSFKAYEEAIEANPQNYFAINNYTYYLSLRKEKLDLAKKLSERMVKENPENATFLDTHGWVLFQMGNYTDALKYLEKAAGLNGSGTIIEHYGDALYKTGEIEKAINQWEKAREIGGTSSQIDQKIAERKYYE
ncbi:tetratricopeptide repeat protein [Marivirga sp. S37H4]|uniref:Tetratricopeptide repeat protein n=1 Tax=Marivirga aurantiaca TaxID=2802615 RepID=A0A934WYK9_9BACT|nr:tetratricopeptide repeat protein [Marivirga aurantiaca]MBK6265175.1 tetratricopeptide repeat protein [Marivirga aurantiaca]